MRAIIKFFAIITVFLLLLLGPPVTALLLGASLWAGVAVSAGIFGLLLLGLLLRFVWVSHRERQFVHGLVETAGSASSRSDGEIDKAQRAQWKKTVTDLKHSHLRVKGNPLYVLPWYMLLGETGSGKSTAIENSGLSSNLAQTNRVSGTRDCEWWFFNEAIVIDTAGRYATHQDEPLDKREWHAFLRQLARYRKKEPLNGLVVTVSAKTLLSSPREEIEAEGRKIRERTHELMQVTGATFPIYLLVTKCDLIQGMTRFCDRLPPAVCEQVFGCLNADATGDASAFLATAVTQVTEKLRGLRLQGSSSSGLDAWDPALLFFPEEFRVIEEGLSRFTAAAFGPTVYQEPPFLRGIFFSSARQSGRPFSQFPAASRLLARAADSSGRHATDKSYFLHDLFAKVLPGDRHLHAPTRHAIAGMSRLRGIAFAGVTLACIVTGGVMSYSFSVHRSLIRDVQKEYATVSPLRGDLVPDINTLEGFRQLLRGVEQQNRSRLLPDFGLDHSERLERELKELFCKRFQGEFLAAYDTKMGDAVVHFSGGTSTEVLADVFLHYIRRINLINARMAGGELPELSALAQPDFGILVGSGGHRVVPAALEMVEIQYRDYLLWESRERLTGEKAMLASWLAYLVKNESISLEWLVAWCNRQEGLDPVTLADFWEGGRKLANEPVVRPAFTRKGHVRVEGLLGELNHALETPPDMEKKRAAFLGWYNEAYAQEWAAFASFFPKGKETIGGREARMAAVVRMGTLDNPFFSLLRVMADELAMFREEGREAPAWMAAVFEFDAIRRYATPVAATDGGTEGSVSDKGMRLLSKVKHYGDTPGPVVPESVMLCAEAFGQYAEGLSGIAKASLSPGGAFKLAGEAFTEDPVTGTSPVCLAMGAEETLGRTMENRTARMLAMALIHGPFDFLWEGICESTGGYLQGVWDETVLAEVYGVSDKNDMTSLLFGEGGYVSKFIAGPASPFIGRRATKGYYAKSVAGKSIPFAGALFSYVTRGTCSAKAEPTTYQITIEGLPTDVNPEANIQAHMTVLELEGSETQVLTNRNYKVDKKFHWSPKEGGDVTLKIGVGDLLLEKKYSGVWGFAEFLSDFPHGKHEFTLDEFPAARAALKRMGVRYIRVKYKISGTDQILRLRNMVEGKPPKAIVACLD